MKAIKVVYKKYNLSLINVTDFYRCFKIFYQKVLQFPDVKKVIKMYKNYEEILKHNLVFAGLEPVIN